ncbi:hypothetical protein NHQ30_000483 [Ciborinia camelliae]|nr:hypothetical protein NHQ30_000483 [Ciborinia camelliae]
MSITYTLHEATTRAESDAIVDLAWIAWHEPYTPAFQIFHPVFGPTIQDHEAAILADKERAWNTHLAYKEGVSHWVYVVDEGNGAIIGACQWLIFTETPWPNELPKIVATWWPEGEGRDFATEFVRQCYAPRQQWMNRPHIALNQTSVHPEYRGKGVGAILMKWGTDKADELGLEGFIEASDSGRGLYEKHGFRTLMKLSMSLEKKNASGEWKRLLHEMRSFHFYINWRPVGGVFEEGKPQTPWQVDQVLAKASRSEVKLPVMKIG